jgi:ATP/maltotriose-dependent transcriptional regulator MalT
VRVLEGASGFDADARLRAMTQSAWAAELAQLVRAAGARGDPRCESGHDTRRRSASGRAARGAGRTDRPTLIWIDPASCAPMTSHAAPGTPRIRDALLARADAVGVLPLAIVVAPAGSGKSTLLAAWRARVEACGSATAYLDLSPLHADASVLAADLLEGARHALPSFGGETEAFLAYPNAEGEPWRHLARTWILDVRNAATPLALFLDNFHELPADSPGARLVDELLRARPPQLAFVVSSRGSVPTAASRLRAEGTVTEVDANDLSLRFDEVHSILAAHGAGDDADLATRVLARTEGWATGVQLAARRRRIIAPAERRFVDASAASRPLRLRSI